MAAPAIEPCLGEEVQPRQKKGPALRRGIEANHLRIVVRIGSLASVPPSTFVMLFVVGLRAIGPTPVAVARIQPALAVARERLVGLGRAQREHRRDGRGESGSDYEIAHFFSPWLCRIYSWSVSLVYAEFTLRLSADYSKNRLPPNFSQIKHPVVELLIAMTAFEHIASIRCAAEPGRNQAERRSSQPSSISAGPN
jgi:hypothetical protein